MQVVLEKEAIKHVSVHCIITTQVHHFRVTDGADKFLAAAD